MLEADGGGAGGSGAADRGGAGACGSGGVHVALRSLLFEVGTLDPLTFAGVAGGMVLVGLLAAYLPARRASRADPMESLGGE
jgi:putative ABC transport system permease protein